MIRLRSAAAWVWERVKDLLYDPGNNHLDAGRVAGWVAMIGVLSGVVWNIHLGKEIDLGVTGLPGGLGALLGALVVYLIRDRAQNGPNTNVTINTGS